MILRNLTPHPITIEGWAGGRCLRTFPVDGPAPRLTVQRKLLRKELFFNADASFSVVRTTMGEVEGLPPRTPQHILIVSALVAEACPDRDDLAYPGEPIRDDEGHIVACKGLCAGPGLVKRFGKSDKEEKGRKEK